MKKRCPVHTYILVLLILVLLPLCSGSLLELVDKRQVDLLRRAANTTAPVLDGEVLQGTLSWGETEFWAYKPANNTPVTVYITLNTCTQPDPRPGLPNTTAHGLYDNNTRTPVLTLYTSDDDSIPLPNELSHDAAIPFQFGFANVTYNGINSMIYLSVTAPGYQDQWSNDTFSYQVGVSTTAPLHRALAGDQNRFLFLQDSDFSAALLTTGNLSSQAIPNYQIWVNKASASADPGDISSRIQNSLKWSWCGISQTSALVTLKDADRSMTTRGPGGLPKEQFYVHDLVPSTFYDSYITLKNNNTSGGTIWPVQTFRTRDNTTCQVIYNMNFCSEVAYSVPSNATLFNPKALGDFYDGLAASYYANFSKSVQIVSCNASSDAVYSLVSNCDSCKDAYKNWICAVTIPRCADLTNPAQYLVYRNVSRNPAIEAALHPGEYKEVLPCGDLVQSVTRKCPLILGIRQPYGEMYFHAAYGQRSNNATITCNAPGVDFWVADATRPSIQWWWGLVCISISFWLVH